MNEAAIINVISIGGAASCFLSLGCYRSGPSRLSCHYAPNGRRRDEDMRANQGSRIWILQITVYYKELLTINCQGTNHPRSILSFMDISILYLMVRSLLVTTGSTLFACGSFLSPSVPVRDRREEGPDRRGNVHRSRKKPSEVRWMTKRLEHDRSEGRRTEPLGTRRNPRDWGPNEIENEGFS